MDSRLSYNSAGLELHWVDVAQFRMPSAWVVKAFHVVEDVGTGFASGSVDLQCRPLGFQQ